MTADIRRLKHVSDNAITALIRAAIDEGMAKQKIRSDREIEHWQAQAMPRIQHEQDFHESLVRAKNEGRREERRKIMEALQAAQSSNRFTGPYSEITLKMVHTVIGETE